MGNRKLDTWAEQLLDTGKRNNLINFKDTKATTVEVLIPDADELFRRIDGNASFEIYDPKIPDTDEEDEVKSSAEETPEGKEAYLSTYGPRLKKQSQLLVRILPPTQSER